MMEFNEFCETKSRRKHFCKFFYVFDIRRLFFVFFGSHRPPYWVHALFPTKKNEKRKKLFQTVGKNQSELNIEFRTKKKKIFINFKFKSISNLQISIFVAFLQKQNIIENLSS